MKPLLKNLFILMLFAIFIADIMLERHGSKHGFDFWHYLPGSYAFIGVVGTILLVAIVKILAASGIEQPEKDDD